MVSQVIELLWAEPMGGATVVTANRGDLGFTRMRRFVVIREGNSYCAALSVHNLFIAGFG